MLFTTKDTLLKVSFVVFFVPPAPKGKAPSSSPEEEWKTNLQHPKVKSTIRYTGSKMKSKGVVNIPFSIGCVLCIHKTDRFCIEISPELTIFDTIK